MRMKFSLASISHLRKRRKSLDSKFDAVGNQYAKFNVVSGFNLRHACIHFDLIDVSVEMTFITRARYTRTKLQNLRKDYRTTN
jgi:hypothetical protein